MVKIPNLAILSAKVQRSLPKPANLTPDRATARLMLDRQNHPLDQEAENDTASALIRKVDFFSPAGWLHTGSLIFRPRLESGQGIARRFCDTIWAIDAR
jgi:hypothetical protein